MLDLTAFEVKILDAITAILDIGPGIRADSPKANLCVPYQFGYVPVVSRWGGVEEMKRELIHTIRHTIMVTLDQKLGGKARTAQALLMRPTQYRQYYIRFLKYPQVVEKDTKKIINPILNQPWVMDPTIREETWTKTVEISMSFMVELRSETLILPRGVS